MNKHLANSELATPKVTTGPIAGSRKIFSRPDAAPELKVPLREVALDASSGEPPVPVYDPSGPYTDPDAAIDVEKGLARACVPNGFANAAASRRMRAGRSSRSTTATSPANTSRAISPTRRSRSAQSPLPPPFGGGWGAGSEGKTLPQTCERLSTSTSLPPPP